MNVILLEKVGRLGNLGDQIAVKAGYGRNFLIPQGKAVPANDTNIAEFEQRRSELEAAAVKKKGVAESRAEKLNELTVTIGANAGEEGKLFGSIGTRDIADAITQAGQEVAKSEVRLPNGIIRDLGEFEIELALGSEVVAIVKLAVVAE